jgi:hypothetical protein
LRALERTALLRPVTPSREPDLIGAVRRRLAQDYGVDIA